MSDNRIPPSRKKPSPKEITEAANTAVFRAKNAPVDYAGYYSIKPPKKRRAFDPEESPSRIMGEADYEAEAKGFMTTPPPPRRSNERKLPSFSSADSGEDSRSYSFDTFASRAARGTAEPPEQMKRDAADDGIPRASALPSESASAEDNGAVFNDFRRELDVTGEPLDAFDQYGRPAEHAQPARFSRRVRDDRQEEGYCPVITPPPNEVELDGGMIKGMDRAQCKPSPTEHKRPAKRHSNKILAALIAALIVIGCILVFSSYTLVGGRFISIDATELDLSGTKVFSLLGVSRCSQLRQLDLTGCTISTKQYDRLHRALPECSVTWDVPVTDTLRVRNDTSTLDLRNTAGLDLSTLCARLAYMPQLDAVLMDGCGFSDAQLADFSRKLAYGHAEWSISLGGNPYSSEITELSLNSESNVTLSELAEKLPYFVGLKTVDLSDCGFEEAQLRELRSQMTGCDVVWTVYFGNNAIKTNATELILSGVGQRERQVLPTNAIDSFEVARVSYDEVKSKKVNEMDISPLKDCTSLQTLQLINCGVVDLSPLSELSSLTSLVLSNNAISDLSPLSGISSLKELNLSDNLITDLSPLANMTGLVSLNASKNMVSDLSPLAGMTSLATLELQENKIVSVEPLASLTSLTTLSLSENQIVNISPLKELSSLTLLSIKKNKELLYEDVEQLKRDLPNCTIYSTAKKDA